MSTETTFFSYSRADSAFVLKLAKDLRDAGAELWLDQLDIKPGSHWDSSIEAALGTSKRLLVILSPTSVESNNVMDEVSYALESDKIVIPVLLTECNTPFRLKRLQRIDFTGDYQTGLNHLLEALGHPHIAKVKKENTDTEKVQDKAADKEEDLKWSQVNDLDQWSNEVSLWEVAKISNTVAAYNTYLHDSVVGFHKEEAKKMISQLEAEQKAKELDKLLWEKAKTENNLHAYNDYKTEYPNGTYKAEASAAIKKIEEAERMKKAAVVTHEIKAVVSEPEKKSNSKKYMIAGGAAVLIIVAVLFILNSSSSGTDGPKLEEPIVNTPIDSSIETKTPEQLLRDSINEVLANEKAKAKADSIDKAYKKSVKDSMVVGKSFRGGKIFHIDENGEHGLIVSENDLNENGETDWYAAETLCKTYNEGGFSDWYMPNKEELEKIFKAKTKLGGLPNRYYWSSTEVSNDGTMFELNLNTGYDKRYKKNNKFNIRAVRKF